MSNQHTALPMPARFWAKAVIGRATECWPWHGARQAAGYGIFRNTVAHRVAYELAKGPIPVGLELDHLCRNRACVNPAHLEAVSRRDNILRSDSFIADNVRKLQCPNGHPYAGANLHIRPNGERRCATCIRAANAARYPRRLSTTQPASTEAGE